MAVAVAVGPAAVVNIPKVDVGAAAEAAEVARRFNSRSASGS